MLRLIQKMRPAKKKKKKKKKDEEEDLPLDDKQLKRQLYPGLAIPDNPDVRVCLLVL